MKRIQNMPPVRKISRRIHFPPHQNVKIFHIRVIRRFQKIPIQWSTTTTTTRTRNSILTHSLHIQPFNASWTLELISSPFSFTYHSLNQNLTYFNLYLGSRTTATKSNKLILSILPQCLSYFFFISTTILLKNGSPSTLHNYCNWSSMLISSWKYVLEVTNKDPKNLSVAS